TWTGPRTSCRTVLTPFSVPGAGAQSIAKLEASVRPLQQSRTAMTTVKDPVAVDTEIEELVARARAAQAVFETFSQEQVDGIVRDIAKYVYDNAEPLARMAVDETGIGYYEDKILKNKGKARVIWNSLKGKKSRGVIGEEPEANLILVAKP